MKRFRSVGSDRCSMLLTDFKAGAKFCDKTAIFLGGFNCWRKKESTKSWSGQLWSAVLASSVVGFNDVNTYEHSFFPTPPLVWFEDMSVSSMKLFELHVFSTKKWAPRCASGIGLPRPTARCSAMSSLPRTRSSDISPSLLEFPRNDLDMPWLFLGWTPRRMRFFDGNAVV